MACTSGTDIWERPADKLSGLGIGAGILRMAGFRVSSRRGRTRKGWGSMKIPMITLAGLAATSMVAGVSLVGCSGNKSSTTSSSGSATSSGSSSAASSSSSPASSSSSAPAADYTALLIKASDVTLPGDTFTGQPPIQNPNGQPGVAQLFSNQNDTRHVGDTILILPDPDQAVSELDQEKAALGDTVEGRDPGTRRRWAPAGRWSRAPHRRDPRR